jgi:hypothetical protein
MAQEVDTEHSNTADDDRKMKAGSSQSYALLRDQSRDDLVRYGGTGTVQTQPKVLDHLLSCALHALEAISELGQSAAVALGITGGEARPRGIDLQPCVSSNPLLPLA